MPSEGGIHLRVRFSSNSETNCCKSKTKSCKRLGVLTLMKAYITVQILCLVHRIQRPIDGISIADAHYAGYKAHILTDLQKSAMLLNSSEMLMRHALIF